MNPTVTVLLIMMAAVLTVFTIILYSDYRQRSGKAVKELNRWSLLTWEELELRLRAIDEFDRKSLRKRMEELLKKKAKGIRTEGGRLKTSAGRVRT